MKNLTTAGRVLFALPFALFGINHFIMMDYYVGMLTSFIPLGGYTIILTGLIMIAVSISIITRRYIRLSTLILAGLLLIFILTIHLPHLFNVTEKAPVLIALLKDISLMGGSLMISGCFSANETIKSDK